MNMNQGVTPNMEREIDLRQLFWAICWRWRMVLCWMIVMALVAGAAQYGRGIIYLHKSAEEIATAKATYDTLAANNIQERNDILRRLRDISTEMREQQDYLNNSIYMSIDPYNLAIAQQTYYVKTDYQIMPGMTYQDRDYTETIVNAYVRFLTSKNNLQSIAEKCNIELRYIDEIVGAWSNGQGMFTVRVISNDLADAESLFRLLDASIAAEEKQIEATIATHQLVKFSYSAYTEVNEDLADSQTQKKDALTNLRTQYADQTARYEALKEEYDNLQAPVSNMDGALKSSIKIAIVGAILGAVIACVIVCMQVAVSDRVYSADSLTQRMHLRILGAVPTDPAKISAMGKLDRKLRGRAGLSTATDAAGVYAAAASYLAGAYPEANTVLVAGGAEDAYIQTACEAFQANLPEKKFLPGGNVLSDADTIRKVGQCDLTVLVEHTGTSSYSSVIREAETIQNLKGTIAGALVMEDCASTSKAKTAAARHAK